MKKCPTCSRTYADETLTYCLADGALLSAPYDPEATLHIPTRNTNPPPTEILPSKMPLSQPLTKSRNPAYTYVAVGLLALIIGGGAVALLKSGANSSPSNSPASVRENSSVKNEQSQQTSSQPSSKSKNDSLDHWEGYVSATNAKGVQLESSDGKKFLVSAGEEIEIQASGIVQVRSDGSPSDASGEKGYRDLYVDSRYYDRVGGLEMWIGYDKEDNRYFVGTYFRQKVNQSGIVTLRVIDALSGYKGTGSFYVKVRKVNG